MQLNDHWRKIVKTLIFAFLCTEMQTTYTHRDLAAKRGIGLAEMDAIAAENGKEGFQLKMVAPHQASIRLLTLERDYFGKGHICSGALVAPSVVLTVTSCIFSQVKKSYYHPSELRVVLGSPQRFAPNEQALVFGVTHIHQPPKDLALAILMLDKDVPENLPYIQAIGLPTPGATSILDSDHHNLLQINTWGYDGDIRELHDLVTLNATHTSCHQHQSKSPRICVQPKTSNYIRGRLYMDAGATLTERDRLLGLRSIDGAFEDVASHVEWILAKIGDGGNQNSSIWGILGFLVFTGYVITISRKSFST
uniref:Peptidase S1 domain-containing protein n=2 Tax=Drosophila melanogaster TaxID=7227 RepID=Q9W452_DROME|nr:uncharacterized protein Dmel_CG6067 [Drosophila melanogaster]AAF46106.2 uncharacterized protein Dmel_CG6067 [Drosophila melanogaster]|eukprot:NP_572283.1 uncharacterized protein Dmel_CG6067 [Drosophila melanogaster]